MLLEVQGDLFLWYKSTGKWEQLTSTAIEEHDPKLSPNGRRAAARYVTYGLLDRDAHAAGQAVLTLRGRLLADAVVRDLLD